MIFKQALLWQFVNIKVYYSMEQPPYSMEVWFSENGIHRECLGDTIAAVDFHSFVSGCQSKTEAICTGFAKIGC